MKQMILLAILMTSFFATNAQDLKIANMTNCDIEVEVVSMAAGCVIQNNFGRLAIPANTDLFVVDATTPIDYVVTVIDPFMGSIVSPDLAINGCSGGATMTMTSSGTCPGAGTNVITGTVTVSGATPIPMWEIELTQ